MADAEGEVAAKPARGQGTGSDRASPAAAEGVFHAM